MNAIRGILLALVVALTFTAVGQNVAKAPAVTVSTPNRVLKLTATNACRVDFKNTRMFGALPDSSAKLTNGSYERKSKLLYDSTDLVNVFCIAPQAGTEKHAVVYTEWTSCGGSCGNTGIVQVFIIRHGHPVITQQFVFDHFAEGAGATFDEKSSTLRITARSDQETAHCCPEKLDVVTYQWQGSRFVQRSYKRVPASPPQRTRKDPFRP